MVQRIPPSTTSPTVLSLAVPWLGQQISCKLMPAMKIAAFVPPPLKSLLRRPYYAVRRRWMYTHPTAVETIHEYWRKPDSVNDPHTYLAPIARSKWLVGLLEEHVPKSGSLLELGCNVGRNLNAAYQAGYRDLEAIEINPGAVEILKETFPEMASAAKIRLGRIEDHIRSIALKDCIYTMAVLVHIHPSSEWIFAEMANRAKTLILVESEESASSRHFSRDYHKIFTRLGMHQKAKIKCDMIPELVQEGGLEDYVARIFQR